MHLKHPARGFTLVEVMITIFVVAVGLLSAAALQAVSKKAAFEAVQRSSANAVAQDLIERMRSNRGQLKLYFDSSGTQRVVNKSNPPAAQDCKTSTCSSEQLAAYDLWQWWNNLDGASEKIVEGSGASATRSSAGGLRSPTGCIRRTASSCRVVVAIAWRGMSLINQGDTTATEDPTNDPCGQTDGNLNADYEWNSASQQSFRRVLVVTANLGEGQVCP